MGTKVANSSLGDTRGYHQHIKSKKGLVIAFLNVNGLLSHLDEIKLLIKDLELHIFSLNETKLGSNCSNDLTAMAGYQQERLDRTRCGGGISVYVRNSLKYKLRSDVPTEDLELICIEVEQLKSRPFLIIAWYRPPNDPVGSFNKLEHGLTYLDREGMEIILFGDTNCDLAKYVPDQPHDNNTKDLSDLYVLFSFRQLIEEPTRGTLTTSTIIDHIATTDASKTLNSGVYKTSLSDHYMVYCSRKPNGAIEKDHKMIKTRKMKNVNEDTFLADVSAICWEHLLYNTDDVNVLVSTWSSMFSLIIEKHAPMAYMRVSEKYCPWINQNLKDLI